MRNALQVLQKNRVELLSWPKSAKNFSELALRVQPTTPIPIDLPYNVYDLIFNMGQVDKRNSSHKLSIPHTRRNFFPPLEDSSNAFPKSTAPIVSRDGGWPSLATNPQWLLAGTVEVWVPPRRFEI